ncbi:hypothetical protein Ct9H90mP29_05710 [bacterium]|nr:MAG: hypothetical protein Ct9H90mP29_05710 [bacterium]
MAISDASGYQFAPILVGNIKGWSFWSVWRSRFWQYDLKFQKLNSSFLPEWENNGLTAMLGLDGDVNFTHSYPIAEEDLYLVWEDNRSSKKIFMVPHHGA